MGVSRVDFGEDTLIDLTKDTVTPHSLLSGYSAHNKAGELIEGLVVIPTKVSELKNDSKFITETGDSSKTTVTFEQATERANVQSGDDLETAFAKLSKYCADLKQVAFTGKYSDLSDRITVTNNLLATVSGQSALDAALGPAINTKIESINPLNGLYDTSEGSVFDSHISDVSFISQHPSGIFGHSQELSNDIGIGYWVNVISHKSKNVAQISQVAYGELGTAFRYLDHGSGKWTKWTNLQSQINQINSDLSFAKKLRLSVQYIDALNEEQNGSFYYDFVTKEELPTYPAPIAQNSYYNDNKILGTRKIDKNTIRIYFSDKNKLPLTASILYHV